MRQDVAEVWPMTDAVEDHLNSAQVTRVAVADLRMRDSSPRVAGEDPKHVELLAKSVVDFPPIVIRRAAMEVIDGRHRVRACLLRGDATIDAVFFDGSVEEAFVLAVRLNAVHGLPLSLTDRKSAAQRIVSSHPEWSDRAIAALSGISDKTVAVVRRRLGAELLQPTSRIARNGVAHAKVGAGGRERAAALFSANSAASAREVAQAAGISLTTAKDVKKRIRRGEDPVPNRQRRSSAPPSDPRDQWAVRERTLRTLQRDPALRFSESGRKLLRCLEIPASHPGEWAGLADTVPSHWAAAIADLARQHAEELRMFAAMLDARTSAVF
ncbi:ParB/RepB/Spo0J family partition protein [Nocardia sp. NPDC051570]|uniref:ParB/RepB/Spo0J family partition protein n=1 Tax=Nocardia sp. NPDC051570 TaxID=3364324 RepID=UPI00378CD81F